MRTPVNLDKNHVEAILFDLDDTLFDRTLAQSEALSKILSMFPDLFGQIDECVALDAFLEADRLAIQSESHGFTLGEARDLRSRTFLDLLGLVPNRTQEITQTYITKYRESVTPVSGAMSALQVLHGSFPLGLVSNGYPEVQHIKIDSLKIRSLLEFTLISEEIGIRKPDSAIFLMAAQMIGAEPAKCLFVGDSYENDVVGANGVGMQTCWLNRGGSSIKGEVIPGLQISQMEQLLQAVDAG